MTLTAKSITFLPGSSVTIPLPATSPLSNVGLPPPALSPLQRASRHYRIDIVRASALYVLEAAQLESSMVLGAGVFGAWDGDAEEDGKLSLVPYIASAPPDVVDFAIDDVGVAVEEKFGRVIDHDQDITHPIYGARDNCGYN